MIINNKEYTTPTLNFGAMCKLEQWGLSIGDLSSRPLGFLAGFVGLTIGLSYSDFLRMGPAELQAYSDGYQRRINREAWLYGVYVQDALAAVLSAASGSPVRWSDESP